MLLIERSSCRPPWLETTTPAAPIAMAPRVIRMEYPLHHDGQGGRPDHSRRVIPGEARVGEDFREELTGSRPAFGRQPGEATRSDQRRGGRREAVKPVVLVAGPAPNDGNVDRTHDRLEAEFLGFSDQIPGEPPVPQHVHLAPAQARSGAVYHSAGIAGAECGQAVPEPSSGAEIRPPATQVPVSTSLTSRRTLGTKSRRSSRSTLHTFVRMTRPPPR